MNPSTFYRKRGAIRSIPVVSLREAVELVETSKRTESVIVLPPAAGDSTADSHSEEVPDGVAEDTPFEPAGQMEVNVEASSESESEKEIEESSEMHPTKKRKVIIDSPKWSRMGRFKQSLDIGVRSKKMADEYPFLIALSPYQIWKLFFTDTMLQEIVKQTLLYAHREKNDKEFETSVDEIRRFIGIALLSGYHTVPCNRDYWSNQPDLGVQFVSQAMTCGRYRKLAACMHLADNQSLTAGDKTAKVDPLYKKLNENLTQFGIWHDNISIDESMVPYFGKNSMKQFIRGKLIRFGFKLWAMCSSDGFPYHVSIYSGKDPEAVGPLGERVVTKMVDVLEQNSLLNTRHIFFDNFFTSYRLLFALRERGVRATGTIRENRTGGAHKVLMASSELKKKQRGYFDSVCDGRICVVKWMDNSTVCIASNSLTHEPTHVVRRYVKPNPNHSVQQPHIIHQYNSGMGGVDVMDRLLASYRPMLRGKKWWWPLFLNAVNMSVVAAWKVHQHLHRGETDHLSFRRDIVMCLMKTDTPAVTTVSAGRRVDLPDDVRFDGVGHTSSTFSEGRCRVCSKNTKKGCLKCDAHLHSDRGKKCFEHYHSRC